MGLVTLAGLAGVSGPDFLQFAIFFWGNTGIGSSKVLRTFAISVVVVVLVLVLEWYL